MGKICRWLQGKGKTKSSVPSLERREFPGGYPLNSQLHFRRVLRINILPQFFNWRSTRRSDIVRFRPKGNTKGIKLLNFKREFTFHCPTCSCLQGTSHSRNCNRKDGSQLGDEHGQILQKILAIHNPSCGQPASAFPTWDPALGRLLLFFDRSFCA